MSTFKAIFKALDSVALVKEKMFSIPRLWGGVSPYMRKVILLIYGGTSRITSRVKTLNNLYLFLVHMEKHHGSSVTVKWLKACHVSLQRALGGDYVKSLRDLEPELPLPRTYHGLPSVIPKTERAKIRRGDVKTIQF